MYTCILETGMCAAADNSIIDLQYACNMGVAFLVEDHHNVHIMCSKINSYPEAIGGVGQNLT